MRFLWLAHELDASAGGIQRYCHSQLSHFSKLGHVNHVYSLRSAAPIDPALATVVPQIPRLDRFARVPRLRRLVRVAGIDRIVCTHLQLLPIASEIAEPSDLPIDLFVYGIEAWGGAFRRQAARCRQLDRVISISRFTTDQVLSQGCPPGRIVHVPPSVDGPCPAPESVHQAVARDPSALCLLTVGRLDPTERYKGQDRVIEALPAVAERFPGVRYRIVGAGADASRLSSLAVRLGVDDRVEFAGFVPDEALDREYAAADIFVMPSRTRVCDAAVEGEGFGIVYLEAARHGLPLIGPDTGGACDIVRDGVTGLQVDPDDPAALADAICQLAADPGLGTRLGRTAQQVVRDEFGPSRLATAWEPYFAAVGPPDTDAWERHGWQRADNPFKHELIDRFARGETALDLGAGRGAYGSRLRKQGYRVTALDRENRLGDPDVPFVAHDLEQPLPCPDQSVDLVLAWDIVEHVAAESQLWREMDRVLRPSGLVFMSVPNADDSRIAASHLTYVHHKDRTHVRAYTPADLRSRSARSGWQVMHLEPWGGQGYPYLLLHYIDRPSVRWVAKAFIKTLDQLGQIERGSCHGDLYAVFQKPPDASVGCRDWPALGARSR